MDIKQINLEHIIGAFIGFIAGYITGIITGKLLKFILAIIILAIILIYGYSKYFGQEKSSLNQTEKPIFQELNVVN